MDMMLSEISLSIYILQAGGQVSAALIFSDGLFGVEFNSMPCMWYLQFYVVIMGMFDYIMLRVY